VAKKIASLLCPSCGAPLKAVEHQTRVDCQYCHATIELPEDESPLVIVQPATNPDYHYNRLGGKIIGWLVGAFLILLLGGIGISVLLSSVFSDAKVDGGVRIYTFTNLKLIPAAETETGQQLLGVSYNSDETRKLSLLNFSQSPIVRWQSANLGDESYLSKYVQAGDNVVLVSKTSISAWRKSDGSKIWETSLSDQLPSNCDTCLLATSDMIFALTQIGTLHAIDLQTGQQKWYKNFDEWHDGIAVFNDNPLVAHNQDGVASLVTYDGQNGQVLNVSQPTCPNNIFTDDDQEFDLNSAIITQPGDYYLIYGFWEPGCFEKWDPVNFSRTWQSLMPEEIARGNQLYLFTGQSIFITTERNNKIWKVNESDGDSSLFLENENYTIRPLLFQSGILIVEAYRTKGSTRYEIWGYDSNSGERLWQIIPDASRALSDNPSSIIDSSGVYAITLQDGQLIMLQAFDEPARLTFDQIELTGGVRKAQTTYTLPDQTVFSLTLIGWQNHIAWLEADGIYGFDAYTGQPVAQWP
jgi:outer membrane protein assembly factor BamB